MTVVITAHTREPGRPRRALTSQNRSNRPRNRECSAPMHVRVFFSIRGGDTAGRLYCYEVVHAYVFASLIFFPTYF